MQILRAALVALALWATPLCAGDFTPVDLGPVTHQRATLTVVAPDGSKRVYAPADLERFPTYRLTTTTPWRETPTVFEGVMLRDVLSASGLVGPEGIIVSAEDNYSTPMSRAMIDAVDVMIATRVDGQPHRRRNRGPIQFVIDSEDFTRSDLASEAHFVWMVSRIEADS